jgi:hypothetical protein
VAGVMYKTFFLRLRQFKLMWLYSADRTFFIQYLYLRIGSFRDWKNGFVEKV